MCHLFLKSPVAAQHKNNLHCKLSQDICDCSNVLLDQHPAMTSWHAQCHTTEISVFFTCGCLLSELNWLKQVLLAWFWPAVVANLSFPSSLVPLLLSSLHPSYPVHSFPVSSCACRRSCNDESVAAVCLCIWHRDVFLLALTPSLSLNRPPHQQPLFLSISLSLSLCLHPSLFLSLPMLRRCLPPTPLPASEMEQTEHRDPPTKTNRNWAPRFAHWFSLGAFLK